MLVPIRSVPKAGVAAIARGLGPKTSRVVEWGSFVVGYLGVVGIVFVWFFGIAEVAGEATWASLPVWLGGTIIAPLLMIVGGLFVAESLRRYVHRHLSPAEDAAQPEQFSRTPGLR
jgi:hypothetical protein